MKNILFFFPHNPFPPRTGAHRRCLELLSGLKDLGCQVTFASSTYPPFDQAWSVASAIDLQNKIGCSVKMHHAGFCEKGLSYIHNAMRRLNVNDGAKIPTVTSVWMKSWFSQVIEECKPDIVFINYMYCDSIFDNNLRKSLTSVIETHDLATLNTKMQHVINELTGARNLLTGKLPSKVLDLELFDKMKLSADIEEFQIYDKYDFTLCISEEERKLVDCSSPKTKAVHLPMTCTAHKLNNNFSGSAFFCIGPNLFNVQGYYLFIECILPKILKNVPDFKLIVTGSFMKPLKPRIVNGIDFRGFVPDLLDYYENGRFFICPVFAGTGQQVKIMEAMANGLAVVAFKNAALRSPLQHEINGLIASDIEEFTEHIIRLWGDSSLCRRLGENARKTIEECYGREKLISGLMAVLY